VGLEEDECGGCVLEGVDAGLFDAWEGGVSTTSCGKVGRCLPGLPMVMAPNTTSGFILGFIGEYILKKGGLVRGRSWYRAVRFRGRGKHKA
jgi:hypothetical protein